MELLQVKIAFFHIITNAVAAVIAIVLCMLILQAWRYYNAQRSERTKQLQSIRKRYSMR